MAACSDCSARQSGTLVIGGIGPELTEAGGACLRPDAWSARLDA